MPRKKENRFCIGVYNMDTESTKDGYVTAFMANKFKCRLKIKIPKPKIEEKPTRKYNENRFLFAQLIDGLPEQVRLTQQGEIRAFFRFLQDECNKAAFFLSQMDSKLEKPQAYIICHFANLSWDLDVLRGIIFTDDLEARSIGSETDLIQFSYGKL